MTATQNILLPEEIIDTYKLQFKSLREFMQGLGYTYEGRLFGSPHFVSSDYENKARKSISVHTATLLHNGAYTDWHGKDHEVIVGRGWSSREVGLMLREY